MLTENDSSQPAMRVKRRGEKSLAGLIAAPAFRPKLEIYKLIFYQFRPNERFFCIKSTTNLRSCLLIIFLPIQISNITLNIATIHFKNKNVTKTRV